MRLPPRRGGLVKLLQWQIYRLCHSVIAAVAAEALIPLLTFAETKQVWPCNNQHLFVVVLLWQHDSNRTTISTITNNGDVVGSLTITVTTMPKQWLWWCWFYNNWAIRNNSQTTVPKSKFAHEVVVCCCSCSCFVDLTPSRHQQRIRPDGLGLGSIQEWRAVVRLRA